MTQSAIKRASCRTIASLVRSIAVTGDFFCASRVINDKLFSQPTTSLSAQWSRYISTFSFVSWYESTRY